MFLSLHECYHIYNRGNNKQPIFFKPDNYIFFIKKLRTQILPVADILAYCLMPNHFHLMVNANENTVAVVKYAPVAINALTEGIRLTLSSYTKALQQQRKFTGSLFQQKTKCKCIDDGSMHYGRTAFHYIHQNAYKAGLVDKAEKWEQSSLLDYLGLRNGTLCNQQLAMLLLDLNKETLLEETYKTIPDSDLKLILKPGY